MIPSQVARPIGGQHSMLFAALKILVRVPKILKPAPLSLNRPRHLNIPGVTLPQRGALLSMGGTEQDLATLSPPMEPEPPAKRQRRISSGALSTESSSGEEKTKRKRASSPSVGKRPLLSQSPVPEESAPSEPKAGFATRTLSNAAVEQNTNPSGVELLETAAVPKTVDNPPAGACDNQQQLGPDIMTAPQDATTAGTRPKPQPQKQSQGQHIQGNKKVRQVDEAVLLHRSIASCAKLGDALALVELLDQVKEQPQVKLQLSMWNTMLYMLTGQESWEQYIGTSELHKRIPKHSHNESRDPKVLRGGELTREQQQQLLGRADEVWRMMQERGLGADEVTYAALARLAAIRGDYQTALHWGKVSVEQGHPMRLRSFAPALMGFADTGDVAGALEVDELLRGGGLDLEEPEYALLLEAVRRQGTYQQFTGILQRLREDLNELSELTVTIIRQFFQSEAAAAAFVAPGLMQGRGSAWEVQQVAVELDGSCQEADGRLAVMDLEEAEWTTFASGVAQLAIKQGCTEFGQFVAWHDEHGPFDYVVDAANVAFYGQNKKDGTGGFSWAQVTAMWKHLQSSHPNKRILMVLHSRRVTDQTARHPDAQHFIRYLRDHNALYASPIKSNDDWYWLYASVRAGRAGVLVSNDEMRDHLFNLLRPKHFLKWRERHRAHYTVLPGQAVTVTLPPPFTPCVQQLPSGSWMVPISGQPQWLCAKPVCNSTEMAPASNCPSECA